ncbi:MFS transporter [Uliginosibacterium sediminicola]|uniref:MFS transporter n=1 Tax=Uliginosibacterium sediminicola TaxID=2024550 RepID=A0ABU9YU30_9RHOO
MPSAHVADSISHQPLPAAHLPRGLGYVLGLVTAVDFWSSLSVLLAAEDIQAGLRATPAQFLWLLTIYAGAGIATLPLIERASRRWHYRNLMACGIALYLLGAVLAAMSSTLWLMIPARLVQGIGGGGLFTMSRVYLQLVTPQAERPPRLRAYIIGLLGGVAPLPWLTAVLVQAYGWRASFLLQATFACLVLLLVLWRLRAERHTPRSLGSLDWPMSLSFALGMMLLLHGLEGLEVSRFDARQLFVISLALACLGFAAWRSHRHPDPLLRLSVLGGRRYLVGLGFYGLYYLVNGATSYLYPRLFDQALGLGLATTGALQSFSAAVTVLCLPLSFRFASKLGDRRRLIALGFSCAGAGLLWLCFAVGHQASWQSLLGPMALKALFPILGVIQIAGLTYTEVPHEDFSHAYALKNIVRLISSSFSAGLLSQYWLISISRCKENLLECRGSFGQAPLDASSGHALQAQMTIRVGQESLVILAFICVLAVLLVLRQKRLR